MSSQSLRESAIAHGKESRVEVNQRLLIDKMLARYASNFVVCRELMQNADDAKATNFWLEIDTEKEAGGSICIKELRGRNDGTVFGAQDWKRLVSIAEGNPDEDTVGMFGVGFYSVFSLTEEPIVSSGSKYIAFAWKGNQLTTYSRQHGKGDHDNCTRVIMKMRERHLLLDGAKPLSSKKRSTVPTLELDPLKRFLAKVVCFTKTLSALHIIVDGKECFRVSKHRSVCPVKHIAKPARKLKSPEGFFGVHKLALFEQRFEVVETSLKGKTKKKNGMTLALLQAQLSVDLDDEFQGKAMRIMKKRLPKITTVQMMFPLSLLGPKKDDSLPGDDENVLSRLVPLKDVGACGQVFVGLATHQTVGMGFHVHAQLIPTIERENIDFQDPYLGKWNSELMTCIGQLWRAVYDSAMSGSGNAHTFRCAVRATAADASHPSAEVGELLVSGFLHQGKAPHVPVQVWTDGDNTPAVIALPGTEGLLPANGLEDLVPLPVVPTSLVKQSPLFFKHLEERGFIMTLTLKDVQTSLKQRVLPSVDHLLRFLQWYCAAKTDVLKLSAAKQKELLGLVRWRDSAPTSVPKKGRKKGAKQKLGTARSLKSIRFFARDVSRNLPVPPTCLPLSVSSLLSTHRLTHQLCLKPLPLATWVRHTLAKPALWEDQAVAPELLSHLSTNVGLLVDKDWKLILKNMKNLRCIPTSDSQQPMQCPRDAYLPSHSLPSYLPQVTLRVHQDTGNNAGVVDLLEDDKSDIEDEDEGEDEDHGGGETTSVCSSFLIKLGVRSVPTFALLREGLGSGGAKELVRSLLSDGNTLSDHDIKELAESRFLPGVAWAMLDSQWPGDHQSDSDHELYPPSELLFPAVAEQLAADTALVLQWTGVLPTSSREYNFLKNVGVRECPPPLQMLHLCARRGQPGRTALAFLAKNWRVHVCATYDAETAPSFLPAVRPATVAGEGPDVSDDGDDDEEDEGVMCAPSQCFAQANPFFPVLSDAVHALCAAHNLTIAELGVKPHPALQQALDFMAQEQAQHGPYPRAKVSRMLTFLYEHCEGVKATALKQVRNLAFLPCADGQLRSPSEVFLRRGACRSEAALKAIKGNKRKGNTKGKRKSTRQLARRTRRKVAIDAADDDGERQSEEEVEDSDDGERTQSQWQTDLSGLVTFVDFGVEANLLLSSLHVTDDPKPAALANAMMDGCDRFLQEGGNNDPESGNNDSNLIRFCHLLRELADCIRRIDQKTLARMKKSKWLPAFKHTTPQFSNIKPGAEGDGGEDKENRENNSFLPEVELTRASECYLVDDHKLARILRPWSVPELPGCSKQLYQLYEHLGSQWLGRVVKKQSSPVGRPRPSSRAIGVQEQLRHRLPLLTVNRRGDILEGIVAGRAAALRSLQVFEVDAIAWDLRFLGKKYRFEGGDCPACTLQAPIAGKGRRKQPQPTTLYLARAADKAEGDVDFYDVAEQVAAFLLEPATEQSVNHMFIALATPLDILRKRGLPVDRLLRSKAPAFKIRKQEPASPNIITINDDDDPTINDDDDHDGGDQHGGRRQRHKRTRVELGGLVKDFGADMAKEKKRMHALVKRGKRFKSGKLQNDDMLETEVSHQCEAVGAQDLRKDSTFSRVPLFIDAQVSASLRASLLPHADVFARLLVQLAGSMRVAVTCLHMFVDVDGARVAFNNGGALFFNLRCFAQRRGKEASCTTQHYWFVVLCHEVAHNGESGHNANHEHIMETLIATHLATLPDTQHDLGDCQLSPVPATPPRKRSHVAAALDSGSPPNPDVSQISESEEEDLGPPLRSMFQAALESL